MRLRTIVNCSELSVVVSLLSSHWSKPSLHTRVLSDTSLSGFLADEISDASGTPSIHDFHRGAFGGALEFGLWVPIHAIESAISLDWRPCCNLNCIGKSFTWACKTCGYSTIIDLVKAFRGRKLPVIDSYQESHEGRHEYLSTKLDTSIKLLDNVRADPILGVTNFESNSQAEPIESEICEIGFLDIVLQHPGLATDRFGNSALHHAAAAQNYEAILGLLAHGLPAELLNTSGQTFLHVLNPRHHIDEYTQVSRQLIQRTVPFPFFHKDNFGHSIIRRFLMIKNYGDEIPAERLSEIYSVLGTPRRGDPVLTMVDRDLDLDFNTRLATLRLEEWADGDSDLAVLYDRFGDTCLIAILKKWPDTGDMGTLLNLVNQLTTNRMPKANVNACDEFKRTPLFIATTKGMCSVVERLLDLGANPNATAILRSPRKPNLATSVGHSILNQAAQVRKLAQEQNDMNLYAAIIQCEKLLVLRGAIAEVQPLDEFSVRRA